jgi:hypothetical protein
VAEGDKARERNSDSERQQELREAIKAIVVTRERTPRSPRWAAAWRRSLFRYVEELNSLSGPKASDAGEAKGDEQAGRGEGGC